MSKQLSPSRSSAIERASDMYELRLFVQFVQGLFNHFPTGCYHFSHDREDTDILITLKNSVDMSVVSKYPVVEIGRSGFQERPMGMGGFLGYDDSGATLYTRLIRGAFIITCTAGSEVEASGIASIIKTAIMSMYDILESEYGFQDIGGSGISTGAASPSQSVDNAAITATEVSVQVPYTIQKTISVKRDYNPAEMSLATITSERHASDHKYSALVKLAGVDATVTVDTEDIT